MTLLRNIFTVCVLAAPLCALAQADGQPGAEHSEHSQPAAGPAGAPMQGRMMGSMSPQNGMMGDRMRAIEDRLTSIEQLLQQLLEHQRAEEAQNATSRRDRDRRR
jgi:hypothetical protein